MMAEHCRPSMCRRRTDRASSSCTLIEEPPARPLGQRKQCRDVAQPGRALAWGARGRQFKSARPDH